jgi:hypothetical protein
MVAELERQPGTIGIADGDGLPVVDLYHRHPPMVDEHAVETAVVDGHPPASLESQHHMRARHQWMCDAHVGAQVATDDNVMAGRESTVRPVRSNGEGGRH